MSSRNWKRERQHRQRSEYMREQRVLEAERSLHGPAPSEGYRKVIVTVPGWPAATREKRIEDADVD